MCWTFEHIYKVFISEMSRVSPMLPTEGTESDKMHFWLELSVPKDTTGEANETLE